MNITIRHVVELGDKRTEKEITVTDVSIETLEFTMARIGAELNGEEPK